jgi:hypothetical protein
MPSGSHHLIWKDPDAPPKRNHGAGRMGCPRVAKLGCLVRP